MMHGDRLRPSYLVAATGKTTSKWVNLPLLPQESAPKSVSNGPQSCQPAHAPPSPGALPWAIDWQHTALSPPQLATLLGGEAAMLLPLCTALHKGLPTTLRKVYEQAAAAVFGRAGSVPKSFVVMQKYMRQHALEHVYEAMVNGLTAAKRQDLMAGLMSPIELFSAHAELCGSWQQHPEPLPYSQLHSYFAAEGRLDDLKSAQKIMSPEEKRGLLAGRMSARALNERVKESKARQADVIIIGAGVAGIAAAQELLAQGLNVIVLEARERPGGRTHTDEKIFGVPFDQGAAWLHCAEENPLTPVARAMGFTLVDDLQQHYAFGSALSPKEAGLRLSEQMGKIADAWAETGAKQDIAASRALPQQLNPYTRAAINHLGPLSMGADAKNISTKDFATLAPEAGDKLVKEGLGAVVAAMAHGVPIKLNTPVSHVEWGEHGVCVSAGGQRYSAKKILVTSSTGVLAKGKIKFNPPLPDWKTESFAKLPMALLNKIALQFDRDIFAGTPAGTTVVDLQNSAGEAFLIRPLESNVVVGFVGGEFAKRLESRGAQAAIEFGLRKLRKIYGSKVDEAFVKGEATAWQADPWTLGAYTAAAPGYQHMRQVLKKTVGGTVFFAGEACSQRWGQSVPGAFESGVEAAKNIGSKLRHYGQQAVRHIA